MAPLTVHALGQLAVRRLRLLGQDPQEHPLLERAAVHGQPLVEPLAGQLHGQEELARQPVHRHEDLEIEQFEHESIGRPVVTDHAGSSR